MTSVTEQKMQGQVRFVRLPEVMARTGLSRSTIYVRLDQGCFPRPVSLGGRAVGWIEAEVDEWIRERIAASRSIAELRTSSRPWKKWPAGEPVVEAARTT